MKKDLKTGQSILEYTLLLGMIIAVILVVLFKTGGIKEKVEATYDATGKTLGDVTTSVTNGVFGMK